MAIIKLLVRVFRNRTRVDRFIRYVHSDIEVEYPARASSSDPDLREPDLPGRVSGIGPGKGGDPRPRGRRKSN